MAPSAKHFAQRLNSCLDDSGAPIQIRERAAILSKMIDISKQQAWSLLEGQQLPDPDLLQKIAEEFEVDPKWLSGEK
ncbi:MAG: XRE family transcriptional regulator [Gammaproteobacteria bacterium]|nr:MAG: XRE family transcriptional regulator [Gammaproteobacteria bacterium]